MALSSVASTVGKFAMDSCLYMSQNFNFLRLPVELTTGSSIMPHKKNPDVFELIRAKCNSIQALPEQIGLIIGNLPLGYFRDLQLIKETFIPVFDDLISCLDLATFAVENITINKEVINEERYKYAFSVEEVNRLVLNGVLFRDAYKQVGEQIETGNFKPNIEIIHTHEGSIGNLCTNEIKEKMNVLLKSFNIDKVDKAIEALIKG